VYTYIRNKMSTQAIIAVVLLLLVIVTAWIIGHDMRVMDKVQKINATEGGSVKETEPGKYVISIESETYGEYRARTGN